jgi:D-alanyl-lipoteichoic acid acyltransferase DltB (MBOAT superfamily)
VVFNSFQYAVFLPLVLLIYWRLKHRGQNVLLLLASYAFYAFWDPRFLLLMAFSTITDFTVGRVLDHTEDEGRRRLYFGLSLVVNLGILGFFKYFNFFIGSAADLLERLGFQSNVPTLRVLLPVGISFYTFHGISYTFDVFRRHIEPTRDLLTFAVFVSFFPQLVAGPIGRAHLQLPQFEHPRRRPDRDQVMTAVFLILQGLVKKIVIADALAPYVNRAFASPLSAGWVDLLVGAYAFALQIYGDFSGYSDVARGSARLLGVELPRNFNQPYLARNITEFWQRWHISLSTWLRDYLYVPLGGNRGSKVRTYRNLFLTMLIGGLWHGAAWTFVVWGAYHGALLVAHRALARQPQPASSRFRLQDIAPAIGTFHLVCIGWVIFRASSIGVAGDILHGIFTLRSGPVNFDAIALLVPVAVLALVLDLAQRQADDHEAVLRWPVVGQAATFTVFVLAMVVFSGGTPVPFIYFQF